MASAAHRPLVSGGPRTVLVAEDDPFLRMLIADALREAGMRVFEAVSADDAMTVLSADIAVDAVLTDVRMPGTMDGVALAMRLAVEYPWLPVFVASGDLDPVIAGTLPAFIAKPYDINAVVALILERVNREVADE